MQNISITKKIILIYEQLSELLIMKYFKNFLIKFVEVNSIHPQEHSTTNSCLRTSSFNPLYIKPLLNLKSKSTSCDSIQCFMETAKTASYIICVCTNSTFHKIPCYIYWIAFYAKMLKIDQMIFTPYRQYFSHITATL